MKLVTVSSSSQTKEVEMLQPAKKYNISVFIHLTTKHQNENKINTASKDF